MSTGRFAKRDREKARQAKAAAKRARRHGVGDGDGDGDDTTTDASEPAPTMSQDDVLAALAKLHEAYDAERMSLEDFEQARADLMAQLRI